MHYKGEKYDKFNSTRFKCFVINNRICIRENNDTTTENLQMIENFICSTKNIDNLDMNKLTYNDVYSLSGENRYLEVNYEDCFLVYDKKESSIKEFSIYNHNPYFGYDGEFKIYNEYFEGFKYGIYFENMFIDLEDNLEIDFELILEDLKALESDRAGNYYNNIPIPADAVVIPNAFYFQNLNKRHAWNELGSCTIVSMEILLGYYDTFYNDRIVEEHYECIAKENIGILDDIKNFSQSPGVDNYLQNDNDFHDYLCSIAKNEIGDDPEENGMSTLNQINLLKNYFAKRNIDYKLETSEGNLGDIWTQRALTIIKNGIKAGRPVISNGSGHSTVAFAYNNEYVWVHTGWGWVGATPWSTFESGMFENYSAGCIDACIIEEHVHSDNYYFIAQNIYICPCGMKHTSTLISPEDYGFEPQYYFYSKSNYVTVGEFSFLTERLRTGYIENEYINLSPYRQDAGEAYLELYFETKIRQFDINLSYWQIKDKLSNLNATASLEVLNQNSVWIPQLDLINDVELSTNRYEQNNFVFNYVGEEITGIRIVMSSPAIGDRNLGRISIGNINLIHEF